MAAEQGNPEMQQPFRFSPRPNRAAEIVWQQWGDEVLQRSRAEHKLVLLSISAVWCHWCHVMDETTFSDDQVIGLINENFIPVRVDSDQRPDLNSRYNQGGWPTVAFLTAEGEVVAGSTYLPPADMQRHLTEVAQVYRQNSAEIEAALAKLQAERQTEPELPAGELDKNIAATVLELSGGSYDEEYGGFGEQPKFIYPGLLALILSNLADAPIDRLEEIATTTLDRMAAGGIYDQVEGGFFRYATARDWSAPHYEKMLEENAALLAVYADAWLLTEKEPYAEVARGIFAYLDHTLRDRSTGAFGGSQDADEQYYRLAAEARGQSPAPAVDRTVYAGANALTASCLLRGFQLLGEEEMRSQALAALEFVWSRLWDKTAGLHHYYDGAAQLPGLLADTGRLLAACLDAYESGGGELWLDRSLEVGKWLLENLLSQEEGAFYDCRQAPGDSGFLAERSLPLVENGVVAAGLIRLSQNTAQTKFGDAARRALKHFAGIYQQYGTFAADYALAVQRLLDPPVRVTIVGPPAEQPTIEMIRAAHRALVPFRSIEVLDPEIHAEELDATGYGYDGSPIAYICIAASCQAPVFDPTLLPQRLRDGRRR